MRNYDSQAMVIVNMSFTMPFGVQCKQSGQWTSVCCDILYCLFGFFKWAYLWTESSLFGPNSLFNPR